MWRIFQSSKSASSSAEEQGSTVYSLEFSDKPMHLVQQNGESFTGSKGKSAKQNKDGKHSSD